MNWRILMTLVNVCNGINREGFSRSLRLRKEGSSVIIAQQWTFLARCQGAKVGAPPQLCLIISPVFAFKLPECLSSTTSVRLNNNWARKSSSDSSQIFMIPNHGLGRVSVEISNWKATFGFCWLLVHSSWLSSAFLCSFTCLGATEIRNALADYLSMKRRRWRQVVHLFDDWHF